MLKICKYSTLLMTQILSWPMAVIWALKKYSLNMLLVNVWENVYRIDDMTIGEMIKFQFNIGNFEYTTSINTNKVLSNRTLIVPLCISWWKVEKNTFFRYISKYIGILCGIKQIIVMPKVQCT